jgi:diguanylate cyclase (GGDEF)-like protein
MATPDPPYPPASFTVEDRDRTADDRDRTSDAHDRASEGRDDRSDARDARAADREQQDGRFDADAAADRAGARRDRRAGAGDRKHSEDDRDAASADRVRAAVDRANLVVDGLTGAHQRAPGLAELEREIVKARRTGQPFVLAFMDVDGLKAINDTHGHAAGDDVLRQVVAVVRKVVRDYDLIIRYGGDEFVCGLLDLNLDDAANRFANTRKDLAGHGVAFSVGLAVLGGNDSLQDLIDRADRAMYEQRKSRDSVGGADR